MDNCDSWKCSKALVKGVGSDTLLVFFPIDSYPALSTYSSLAPQAQAPSPPSNDWHRNREIMWSHKLLNPLWLSWVLALLPLVLLPVSVSASLCPLGGHVLTGLPCCVHMGTCPWSPYCNHWLLLPGINITSHWGQRSQIHKPSTLPDIGAASSPSPSKPPSQTPRPHLPAPTHVHLG